MLPLFWFAACACGGGREWSGSGRRNKLCRQDCAPRRTLETTISFNFTTFLCVRFFRIFISRMAVMGKPSFSLSCQTRAEGVVLSEVHAEQWPAQDAPS